MNKQLFYSITGVLFLIVVVIGSTYSFYSANASGNTVNLDASKLEVIYTGGTSLNGNMPIVSSRDDGYITELNIRVSEGSSESDATLFIHIDEITPNLAIAGYKWYVEGVRNGQTTYTNSGNFAGKNDTNNNVINIVENYHLTSVNTVFTLYLWIDGNLIDNNILGGEFSGYVGATTDNFTGKLS